MRIVNMRFAEFRYIPPPKRLDVASGATHAFQRLDRPASPQT
ncbi:ubiquinol oxidase [Burkholderia pseudomallei]